MTVGTAYICTTCGDRFDADGAGNADGLPCRVCKDPMRWASKESSPAGRYALHRFHGHSVEHEVCPHPAAVCPHPVRLDDGRHLRLCPNPAPAPDEVCDHHSPKPSTPEPHGQLDLFSDLFT